MKKSLAIFKIKNQILFNQMTKILNTKLKKASLVMGLTFVLGIMIIGGYWLSNSLLQMFLKVDPMPLYLLVYAAAITISLITMIMYALIQFLTPPDGTLNIMLRWLPTKPFERGLSRSVPMMINMSIIPILFMIAVFLLSMFVNGISGDIIFTFILSMLTQILIIVMILMTMQNILIFCMLKLKLPFAKNMAITAVMLSALIYMFSFMNNLSDLIFTYQSFNYNPFSLGAVIYLAIYNQTLGVNINFFIAIMIYCALIMLFVLSLF